MHELSMPDGSAYTVKIDHGLIKLIKTTAWSSDTFLMDGIVGRLIADSLHDCCDSLEAEEE